MKPKDPSPDEIRAAFFYHDGDLYWLVPPPRSTIVVGEVAGGTDSAGYRYATLKGRKYYVHRLIWILHYGPVPDGLEVDHRNRVRSDNRIENFRLLTHAGNGQNREAKRIYLHRNRWVFQRQINGQKIWKSFGTQQEALAFSQEV